MYICGQKGCSESVNSLSLVQWNNSFFNGRMLPLDKTDELINSSENYGQFFCQRVYSTLRTERRRHE